MHYDCTFLPFPFLQFAYSLAHVTAQALLSYFPQWTKVLENCIRCTTGVLIRVEQPCADELIRRQSFRQSSAADVSRFLKQTLTVFLLPRFTSSFDNCRQRD